MPLPHSNIDIQSVKVILIIYWIFWWYLNRYYSMILIWCYYLASRMLPLGKLQLNSLVSVFINILLSFCSNCFISTSRLSLLQYGLSLTWIWPPKVRKMRKTRKRLVNILLLALVIIFIRFLCEAQTFFQDYFSSPSFVMFNQTNFSE